MKKYFLLLILATILITVNCSTAPPTRTKKDSSIIAIHIFLQVRTSLLSTESFRPSKIYFIKIDNGSILKVDKVLESNYWTESWNPGPARYTMYLMGAEPGKYAAVAALGGAQTSSKATMVFFPEKVINSSIVDVHPNSVAYMGHFYFTTGKLFNGMENADELQKYYYKLLPRDYGRGIAPQENGIYNSEEFRKEFIKSKASEFKDTEWKEVFKQNKL